MLREFKAFAVRGNVIDMAIGVVIGTAFGRIVTSLVNDILMPPIGMVLGRVDFSNLYINLSGTAYESLSAAREAGAPTINYGDFFNAVIHFVIIAFAMFLLVRQANRLRPKEKEAEPAKEEPTTKECPYCCSTIPLKAIRCPACTSQLKALQEQYPSSS